MYSEDLERFDAYIDKLYSGHLCNLEYRMQLPAKALKWVQSIGTPVFNQEHKVCRIDGVIIDITEQKNAQAQLESSFSISADVCYDRCGDLVIRLRITENIIHIGCHFQYHGIFTRTGEGR